MKVPDCTESNISSFHRGVLISHCYYIYHFGTRSKKTSVSKLREPSETGHGWNLYVISTVSELQLYREMVHFNPDLIMPILLNSMGVNTHSSPSLSQSFPVCPPSIQYKMYKICLHFINPVNRSVPVLILNLFLKRGKSMTQKLFFIP